MKGKILTISVIVVVAALITVGAAFVGSQLVFAQGQPVNNNIIGNIISQVVGTPAAQVPAVKGLVAIYVNSGGPADTAGVKRGDIILKMNSTEVNTNADVKTALTSLKPGDTVALNLTHGDEQKQMDLKLGDRGGNPDLGMTLLNGATNGFARKMFRNPQVQANGALVVSVDADSPASQAGLKQGDVILSVDGTDVTPVSTLANLIAALKSADKVTLKVQSGATSSDVSVTLGDKSGKAYLGVQYRQPFESNGGAGGQSQGTPRFRFGVPNGVSGLVVNSVVSGGPADKAGIKAGDVVTKLDGNAVTNANEFVAALGAKKVGDTVTLTITPQGSTQSSDVTVTLGENPQTTGKAYLGVTISDGMMPRFKNGGGAGFPVMPFQQPAAPSTGSSS
ncbi:MAG TPA: PDZ domain-containing protein [Anaerolineaceae bacterium]